MEIILPKPKPPLQCDASPRRLPAVDTGSEDSRTPRRSPAIGTGSDKPGVVVVVVSHIQRIGCQPEKSYFTRCPIPLVVC